MSVHLGVVRSCKFCHVCFPLSFILILRVKIKLIIVSLSQSINTFAYMCTLSIIIVINHQSPFIIIYFHHFQHHYHHHQHHQPFSYFTIFLSHLSNRAFRIACSFTAPPPPPFLRAIVRLLLPSVPTTPSYRVHNFQ